jgi:SAM-dependent methyltransferase
VIKYVATAIALKAFSSTRLTRNLYRALGNRVGNKRRHAEELPWYYLDRVKRMLRLTSTHPIVRDGDRVFELGTGWLHWEALTLRLFWQVEGVLFDVWDNRQLGAVKNYVVQLRMLLEDNLGLPPQRIDHARTLIDQIAIVSSFDELYKLLGFRYVVENSGSLRQFDDSSFQLIVSAGVLEHVKRNALKELISETHRMVKPGGWVLHSIDTSDHLSHYDPAASKKAYLRFGEPTWRYIFENQVQYINRVQRGEWLDLFGNAGFELIEEETHSTELKDVTVAAPYAAMDKRDLECTVLRVALRKRAKLRVDPG